MEHLMKKRQVPQIHVDEKEGKTVALERER